jgi:hypothetical protein
MSAIWNLENMYIQALYMGEIPVQGRVESSRVAYGGDVKHTVVLTQHITVYGAVRERVIVEHKYIRRVADSQFDS